MKIKEIITSMAMCLALASCGNSGKFLPTVTGSTFDILVVGENNIWSDTTGQRLNEMLSAPMPGLPEAEDNFKVIYIKPETFDNVLRPARNIIFYNIDGKKYTRGNIIYETDKWASTQAIATIVAPDNETFVKTLNANRQKLLRFFTNAEEKRAMSFYSNYQNYDGNKSIRDMFNVDMLIPGHINKSKKGDDFIWLSNGNVDMMENIMIYSYPYDSEDQFLASHILAKQDSVTEKYIPGPSEGSYMVHEGRVEPTTEYLESEGIDYCIEVRGLWRCENDVMGGPYVSRSYLSPDHKKIITAVAFIYGPGHDKRNKLRMLESTLGSLKFCKTEKEEAKEDNEGK